MEELFAAIKAGDTERVRALVAEDPERASARDGDGLSAVLTALYHRQPEALEALLAADPELGRARRRSHRAAGPAARARRDGPGGARRALARGLHAAAPRGLLRRRPAVRLLLGAGMDADADQENPAGVRPLHSAVAARDHDAARALLEAGADPDSSSRAGSRRCSPPPTTTTPRWPSCSCATAPTPRSRPTTAATRRRWPGRASRSSWRGPSRRRSGPCRSSARGPARARRSPAA